MVEQHYAGMLDRADKEIAEALGVRHGAARVAAGGGTGPGTRRIPLLTSGSSGADDGIRTRDPHLGKETRGVPYHPVAYQAVRPRCSGHQSRTPQDGTG
jgi:hypothetical protein